MKQHFIDAGAFVGQSVSDDQYYEQAALIAEKLKDEKSLGVTTDFVVSEVITFLQRRLGSPAGVQFYKAIKASSDITVVQTTQQRFDEAIKTLETYDDKEFSFVDCVSFTVMREHNLTRAFTFDRHFDQAGFEIIKSS